MRLTFACRSDAASPDKNPGIAGIHERFARLGVIANILRDAEQRKRFVGRAEWLIC